MKIQERKIEDRVSTHETCYFPQRRTRDINLTSEQIYIGVILEQILTLCGNFVLLFIFPQHECCSKTVNENARNLRPGSKFEANLLFSCY